METIRYHSLTVSQECRQKGQQRESLWHYHDLVFPRLMSVLFSPAVASEESEANPQSEPTAVKQYTRTSAGRKQVPSVKRSHEREVLP